MQGAGTFEFIATHDLADIMKGHADANERLIEGDPEPPKPYQEVVGSLPHELRMALESRRGSEVDQQVHGFRACGGTQCSQL